MTYLHACIFAKYADLSGVVGIWEKKCASLCVVEHPAEGKTKRVHCHFLIENQANENWFRDEAKKIMGDYIKRGNYWIASRVQKGEHAGEAIARQPTLVYMLKGCLDVSFAKKFSNQEVEEARQGWVEKVNSDNPATLSPHDYMVNKILKRFDHIKSYKDVPNLVCVDTTSQNERTYMKLHDATLLDEVRSATMKVYWGETRKVPHATQYKQVAGTVFLRIMERIDRFDMGLAQLKNLWY